MPAMTLKDLNQVQTLFSEAGLDYKIELEDGRLSVMGHQTSYPVKSAVF